MEATAALLSGLSLFFLLLHAADRGTRRSVTLRLLGLERKAEKGGVRRRRFPEAAVGKVIGLGKRLPLRDEGRITSLLAESGVPWSVSFLQGLRLLCAATCATLLLPLGAKAFLLAPLAFAAGLHLPLLYLRSHVRRRREEAALDLPEVADFISVLCRSGESLAQALRHAADACSHQAGREVFDAVFERIMLGEGVGDSLAKLADHPCRELRRFGRTLCRAQGSGAPVADLLQELASEMRAARLERGRTRAARTSVIILFPLVFMILPSFLLLTVGGMILGHAG